MKKRIVCGSAAILLTGLTSAVFTTAAPRPRESTKPAVRTAAVVPAAPSSTRFDATLVERGRYIVKTAGCNDCHTPGYAETAGGVDEKLWLVGGGPGWQGGWGTTFPINLRLFMQSLSAEQWLTVARAPSRPPMPWFALRDMSDADLVAIYHYVRSLGAAGTAAPDYLPPGKSSATPVVKFPG